MVAAQGLKRVVEDGSVAAALESSEKFGDRAGRLVADAHKVRNSGKLKWCLCCIHVKPQHVREDRCGFPSDRRENGQPSDIHYVPEPCCACVAFLAIVPPRAFPARTE